MPAYKLTKILSLEKILQGDAPALLSERALSEIFQILYKFEHYNFVFSITQPIQNCQTLANKVTRYSQG